MTVEYVLESCTGADRRPVLDLPCQVTDADLWFAEDPRDLEQAKALWFFGGDRPELSLVFGAEKKSALIRVQTSGEPIDEGKLRASAPASATIGGLPMLTWHDFAAPAVVLLVMAFAFAWMVRPSPALGLSLSVGALAIP